MGVFLRAIQNTAFWLLCWNPFFWFWFWVMSMGTSARGVNQILRDLKEATTWEQYQEAAHSLDERLGTLEWRMDPKGPYAWEVIEARTKALREAWDSRRYYLIIDMIRQSARGFGRISRIALYTQAFSGTKYQIETYVCLLSQLLGRIVDAWPDGLPMPDGTRRVMPLQDRMDFTVQTRQMYGRTTLILKGGAAFGMAHLGVVKALRRHGLLPRIVVGDSTGALIAALICSRNEDDLDVALDGDGIDLDAFATRKQLESRQKPWFLPELLYLTWKRIHRWYKAGHILDPQVIIDCAKANLGSETFFEAYQHTGRILNIVLYQGDECAVLNYITAPYVTIWSAAVASSCRNELLYGDIAKHILTRKNVNGIEERRDMPSMAWKRYHPTNITAIFDETIGPTFHINHHIISQANPSIFVFFEKTIPGPALYNLAGVFEMLLGWIGYYLTWAVDLVARLLWITGCISASTTRFFTSDHFRDQHVTIMPNSKVGDMIQAVQYPTLENIRKWTLCGERATWPAIQMLRMRLMLEIELDRCYQSVREAAQRN